MLKLINNFVCYLMYSQEQAQSVKFDTTKVQNVKLDTQNFNSDTQGFMFDTPK